MSQVTQANKVRAKVNADESGRRVRLDSQYEHVDSTALRALTEEFEAGIRKLTDKYNGERETGEGNEKGQLSPEELLHCVRQALSKVVTGMFSEQLGRHVATLAPAKAADGLEKKQVVGYIDGCFDVMHSGHYNALRQAASICDKLVVGVHTDAEILKWKGPTVMNDEERKATVLACKWVDELAFGTPYNPDIATLDKYGCDFSIHGDDLSGDTYKAVVDAGRFRVVKRTAGVSTTDLVGRLLLATKTHHMNRPDQGDKTSDSNTSVLTSNNVASDQPVDILNLDTQEMKARARNNSRGEKHYSEGLSTFLPTTWRIAQFGNGRIPKADDVVVYLDGGFDLFHVGHIETIKKAKALGTFLYVGIHDDQTVNRTRGSNFPIMNLHERVLNVLSCKYVDEVVIGAPWTVTKDLMTSLNIGIVADASAANDDAPTGLSYPYAYPAESKKLQKLETTNAFTTDNIIKRIIAGHEKYKARQKKKVKKDQDYFQGEKTYVQEY